MKLWHWNKWIGLVAFGLLLMVAPGCSCNLVVLPSTYSDPPGIGDGGKYSQSISDCLEVKPALRDFGPFQIRCGSARSEEVEVVHKGLPSCPRSVRVTGVTLGSPEASGFSILERPALPHTLAPGESMTIKLSFLTNQLQSLQDTLTIQTNAPKQESMEVALKGEGVKEIPQRDIYKQVIQASDILFVVDNSRSMAQEQASLAKNFASFMQWAQRYQGDFQVGVIPVRTGDSTLGCLAGPTKIMTPKTPNLAKVFEQAATGLPSGRGPEMGLESAHLALSEPKRSGCNKGFLRDDAVLSMVFISDEPDQSPDEYEYYLKFFKSLKGEERSHLIRASAVVGPSPGGCRSVYGRASPGPRYLRLASELKGVTASICEADWSKPLEQIGLWSVLSRVRFPLTRPPVMESIRVTINGKVVAPNEQQGWVYDSERNDIEFRGGSIPIPGDTIAIDYLADCPDPE